MVELPRGPAPVEIVFFCTISGIVSVAVVDIHGWCSMDVIL